MPPKRELSINIDINGGTLYLNGSAVTTVYDSRSCAWFKSNDVASALGYANASSSVTQMISAGDKCSLKNICLHEDSSNVESNSRNIFINQNGLMEFLSVRDAACDVYKIRSISRSLNRSTSDRQQREYPHSEEIPSCIMGPQHQYTSSMTSTRASSMRTEPRTIDIDVRGKTLFLNQTLVATVYDTGRCAWFKSNDVAEALGYMNASKSVSGQISNHHKVPFNGISLHNDSPDVSADPRNIFINQSGLICFLLNSFPSCDTRKIQDINLSLKNNAMNPPTSQNDCLISLPQHGGTSKRDLHSGRHIFINGLPVALIVDMNKQAWFKVSDIAAALGFANASSSISQVVSGSNKSALKDIEIHEDSPVVDAISRNIFINQKGLLEVLCCKRRERLAVQVSTGMPRANPGNLSACDKVVLQALYSCFKNFNELPSNLISDPSTNSIINGSSPTNNGLKISPNLTEPLMPSHMYDCITSSSTSESYCTANGHPYASYDYWVKGYIIVDIVPNISANESKVFQSTIDPGSGTNESPYWVQQVHSPKRLLSLIKDLCDPWITQNGYYSLPPKQLTVIVSTICSNFEKTLNKIYELTSRINTSNQISIKPQPLSKDQLASITLRNSTGEWIYIAASKPYAERNVFKVGSTEDRLAKRLAAYQSGRLNEDRYHFFMAFPVHNCKKVDSLIAFFLRPWAQIHEKLTEMYILDFETLCSSVCKITKYYEKSYECVVKNY